ncbi:hypothetical protein JW921_06165, partial [Candidatus Fermentibacterales bacterium]|nr:hypothetical protein [Candidatus Fermentibacterales bacterium]
MTGSGTSGRDPAASGRIPELAGIVLLGALLLLHIPDSVLACAWLLCAALALRAHVSPFSARLPALGLIAAGLVMGAGPQQDAMLVAVSLLLLCTLEEMLWRLLLLASLVGVMSSGQVHGITGLCIGGALASVVGSRRLRVASIGAGALIGLLLLGPPDAAVYPGRIALAGVHRDSGGILISWA